RGPRVRPNGRGLTWTQPPNWRPECAAAVMIRLGDRWLANPLGWRAPMDGVQRPTRPVPGPVRAPRLVTGSPPMTTPQSRPQSRPPRSRGSRPWPTTPLDAAQRAFDLLVCPPAPLAFDGRGFPGLPNKILPLDQLKKLLIDDATPRPVRDAVWRD